MTLNNLELLGISRDFADLGGNNSYTYEDRPVLSATELHSPLNVLFSVVIDWITLTFAGRSSDIGLQSEYSGWNGDFQAIIILYYAKGKAAHNRQQHNPKHKGKNIHKHTKIIQESPAVADKPARRGVM